MNINRLHLLVAVLAILLAAVLAPRLTPKTMMAQQRGHFDLQTIIPKQFAGWKEVPGVALIEPPGSLAFEIYQQELARGYIDEEGNFVMLLVAYGLNQSNGLRLHSPEICYTAQGFKTSKPEAEVIENVADLPSMSVKRLRTRREDRSEPITYWMRVGNQIPSAFLDRQFIPLKYGLRAGVVPDGTLVRVSMMGVQDAAAFAVEDRFIRDLIDGASSEARSLLIGDPPVGAKL